MASGDSTREQIYVGGERVELSTSALSGPRSNQLSYPPKACVRLRPVCGACHLKCFESALMNTSDREARILALELGRQL